MKETVVLCVGSDKVSGDCLGPTVGSLLIEKYNVNAFVYGCIGRTVNSLNIAEYKDFLREKHPNAFIIAVDACLGSKNDVGKIKINDKGVAAGLAVGRKTGRIGDIGVLGIVSEISKDNLSALLSSPYSMVYELAEKVAGKVASLI